MAFNRCPECDAYELKVYGGEHISRGNYKRYYKCSACNYHCRTIERIDWADLERRKLMAIIGWYYLHENGDLIYKRDLPGADADIRESPFAVMLWPIDPKDRSCAWQFLVEASAAGANKERVKELAEKWGCNDGDAQHYAAHIDAELFMDGNQWCATGGDFTDLQNSPAGFGDTALDALGALCKELGWKPQKMWGATFHDLVKKEG